MRKTCPHIIALLVSLALVGCVAIKAPLGLVPSSGHRATLELQPRVIQGRHVQAVVTQRVINRVTVIPTLLTSTGSQPISASTGEPTNWADPNLMQATQPRWDLDFQSRIVFGNLKPQATYSILARAYDASGEQISIDASSSVQVVMTNDDSVTVASLPIQLVDIPFAAATKVTLTNVGGTAYDHVVTTLASVVNNVEFPIASTSCEVASASIPKVLALNGLQANTTYRMRLSAYNASGDIVATNLVDIPVGINNVPPAKTLQFYVPIPPIATTAPSGMAVDRNGNLYFAQGSKLMCLSLGGTNPSEVMGIWDPTPIYHGVSRGANGRVYAVYDTEGSYKYFWIDDWGFASFPSPLADSYYAVITGNVSTYGTVPTQNAIINVSSGLPLPGIVLNNPKGLAVDGSGNLYVADQGNNCIKKIDTSNNTVTTLGSGFSQPSGVDVDAVGNVYVADTGNNCIKKISPIGTVTIVADGFNAPEGVAVDSARNIIYVADTGNNCIREMGL